MRYLLYCVFHSPRHQKPETLLGVAGQPVSLVASNGLSAAVSRTADSDLAPDNSRTLTYENVIESFHRDHTVIPMRYGCLFEEETQIIRLLEQYCEPYKALLKELEGSVEMGIRVLFQNVDRGNPQNSPNAESSASPPATGTAYLTAQRDRYAEKDRMALHQGMISDEICGCLSGLFVRSKREFSLLAGSRLLSLCFLVPRSSVEAFRKAFRYISLNEPAKLLLSGPWPPYNFVHSDYIGLSDDGSINTSR